MKITKRQLRRIIREQVSSPDLSPHLGIVIQQLDDFTASELYTLAKSATEAWRAKQKEAKTGLKKGDVVTFVHDGQTIEGIVKHRGAKYVSVEITKGRPDAKDIGRVWKRHPADLEKV